MLQEIESDPIESEPVLGTDAAQPAAPTKAASLTGALVQRGRDRGAPRIPQVPAPAPAFADAEPAPAPEPAPAAEFAPVSDEVPLVFAKPRKAAAKAPRESRWSEALFVAACCAAFFATFLFVLRF